MELARGAKLSGLREDWSSVIDLLRAVGGRVSVDLQVTRVQQTSEVARTPRAESDELNQFMGTMSAIPYVSTLSDQSERFATAFHALRNQDDLEKRNIDLSIIVSSERPMPALLLRTVGHEIFGSAEFEINHVSEFQHGASDSPFSASEVLRIFHPPYGKIQGRGLPERESPTLYYLGRRKPGSGVKVGTAAISGPRADHNFDFMLEDEARLRHTYVVGRTGTGKTNLLKHMARQDIEAGRGVCVIDPHGDLVDYLSEHLSDRMSETLLLDFGDTDWLYAFNPFRVDFDDSRQRSLHVSDLISVLQTQFYNQYSGPRFNDMVRMGIDTMLQPAFPIEPAIALIEDLYQDNRMTNALMQRFAGSKIGRRWDAMADMRSSDRAELVSWALSKFADLMPEGGLMRLQLCSPWGEYSVSRLISERGILLVRLPDSKLGSQASGFLASLILKRIQRAVFSQPISAAAGEPLTLYIDEFQRVATAGLEPFIAEARKFNCGLVLAHQNLEQLAAFSTFEGARSRELIEVLIGNVGTAISFSVGPRDLDPVSELLGCRPSQLRDLGGFGAMVRTVIDGEQSPPFTISIPDSRSDTGLPASRIALRERMIELDVCRPIAEAIGSVSTLSARLEAALLGQPDRPVEAAKSDADRALDATPEAELALGADESSTDEGTVSVDSGAQAFADYVAVAEREGLIDTGDEGYEAVLQRTAMLTQFHLGGSHAVSLKIADDVLALLGDSFETDSDADFAMNRILDKYGVVSERGRRNWKSFVSASRHLPAALSNGEVISVARLVSGWLARDVGIADELGFHLWYIRGMDSDAQFARMFSEDELLLLAGLMRIEVSVLKHGVMDKVADSLVDRMNTQNRPLIGADDSDGG